MYILELKTVQSSAIRVLIEALKEILTDVNIIFDSTGMKIMAMDSAHTVLVYLKLEHDKFEYYYWLLLFLSFLVFSALAFLLEFFLGFC